MRIYPKYLIFSYLLLLSIDLYAQQRVTIFYDSTWAINSREQASFYRNTIIDSTYLAWIGPVQDHYADGTLSMKGLYQAGQKQGEFAFYYPNGNLKVKGEFVNDLPVGTWRFFYEDGSHWQTIAFLTNDYRVLSYHDPSGVHKVKSGQGRYEGAIYSAAVNDTLYLDGKVEGGYKDGFWVYFDKEGNIIYEEKYAKGKFRYTRMYELQRNLIGKYDKPVGYTLILPFQLIRTERYVYAPDVQQSDYPFFSFLPEADTVYFTKQWEVTDSLSATYYFPTNVKNRTLSTGFLRDYYMSGQLHREGTFMKGMKTGDFREFHPNGQLSARGRYKQDQKIGTWKRYYADGSPRDVIYYEDEQTFIESYWQPDGQLVLDRGNGFFNTEVYEDSQAYYLEGKYLNYLQSSNKRNSLLLKKPSLDIWNWFQISREGWR